MSERDAVLDRLKAEYKSTWLEWMRAPDAASTAVAERKLRDFAERLELLLPKSGGFAVPEEIMRSIKEWAARL